MSVPPRENTPIRPSGPTKLSQAQREVDETKDVMRQNIDRILERDSKLHDLAPRAEALENSSSNFQVSAHRMKRKYWWQNLKMKLIIGGVVAVIIIIIIVAATSGTSGGKN